MTKEILIAEKNILRSTMQGNLAWATSQGHKSPFDYCYEEQSKNITIRFDAKREETAGKMAHIADHIAKGGDYFIGSLTEKPYCTTYMVGTIYLLYTSKLREEITERQVEQTMKNRVRDKIRTELGEHTQLDCKTMQLFKEGILTWEQVVHAHTIDCGV